MTIPLVGAHTGLNIAEHVGNVLGQLCDNWRDKVIRCSADGETNMTGRQ